MKRRHLALGLAATVLGAGSARAETIGFHSGSWDELRRRHAGRPTLVHFWGLTCGPCLEELPRWGKFRESLGKVDLVLVAADPLPQPPDWLTATLAKAGLIGLESWQFQDRFSERLFWEVDQQWQGELPYTIRLGRDGTAQSDLGEADFIEIEKWVKIERD